MDPAVAVPFVRGPSEFGRGTFADGDNRDWLDICGDQIAQITAELTPELFNANNGDPEDFDTRSDNKGAEPEAVTIGQVGDQTFAFVGLERAGGGALVYDITHPVAPEFVQYVRADEDIAPEGLTFIASDSSPNGQNLLVVTNEVSSTLAVYELDLDGTNDVIRGSNEDNTLFGGAGDDTVAGGLGDDRINGNSGDDVLRGGLGNDVLTGDNNSGGQGADTFILAIGEGTDTITDFAVGTDTIQILGASADSISFAGEQILSGEEVLVIVNGVETADLGSSLVIL